MQKYGLAAELDPHNAGVLIVHLSGQGGSRDVSVFDTKIVNVAHVHQRLAS